MNILEFILYALEYGYMPFLYDIEDKIAADPYDYGLHGVSSFRLETILFMLKKLGLKKLTNVTPRLLGQMVGKDPVTLAYEPLRRMYVYRHPHDALKVIEGSLYLLSREELLEYLNNIELSDEDIDSMLYEANFMMRHGDKDPKLADIVDVLSTWKKNSKK